MTKHELMADFIGLIFFVLMFLPGNNGAPYHNSRIIFLVGALVAFGIGLILVISGAK
jgi:hypothetical protein